MFYLGLLQKKKIKSVKYLSLDQTDELNVKTVIKKINKISSPDVLIYSSLVRPMTKFLKDSSKNWAESMRVNSTGMFIICREFANLMKKKKKGSIITISSIYGIVGPDEANYKNVNFETEPDYPFIKGGLLSFSKYLASKYGKYNIRVNSLILGGVNNKQSKMFLSNYNKKLLFKRMAKTEDICGPVIFLSSDASQYMTGSNITVDGGYTAI